MAFMVYLAKISIFIQSYKDKIPFFLRSLMNL